MMLKSINLNIYRLQLSLLGQCYPYCLIPPRNERFNFSQYWWHNALKFILEICPLHFFEHDLSNSCGDAMLDNVGEINYSCTRCSKTLFIKQVKILNY